jgi:hypothetical protein
MTTKDKTTYRRVIADLTKLVVAIDADDVLKLPVGVLAAALALRIERAPELAAA